MEERAKRILREEGLGHISKEKFSDLEEINLIGDTTEEILGLPLSVAKCMNQHENSFLLEQKVSREKIRELSEREPSLFQTILTYPAAKYIEEIFLEDKMGLTFYEHIEAIAHVKNYYHPEEYERYKRYLYIRQQVKQYEVLDLCPHDFGYYYSAYDKAELLLEYVLEQKYVRASFMSAYNNDFSRSVVFEDAQYKIMIPESIEALLFSDRMLWVYIRDVMNYRPWIFFVRNSITNKLEVVVEVNGEEEEVTFAGSQIWHNEVSEQVYYWLVEHFSNRDFDVSGLKLKWDFTKNLE